MIGDDTEEEEDDIVISAARDITGEMVESIDEKNVKDIPVATELETVEVEVTDVNGNIQTITVPAFKTPEVEDTTEEVEQTPIEITPEQPDISGDMMKSIERKDIKSVPIVEEEIVGIQEPVQEVYNAKDRTIFKVSDSPNSVFNTIVSMPVRQIQTIPTKEPEIPIALPTAEVPDVTFPPIELTPLEELSDEDIKGLSDDARKAYGLLDEVSVSEEKEEIKEEKKKEEEVVEYRTVLNAQGDEITIPVGSAATAQQIEEKVDPKKVEPKKVEPKKEEIPKITTAEVAPGVLPEQPKITKPRIQVGNFYNDRANIIKDYEASIPISTIQTLAGKFPNVLFSGGLEMDGDGVTDSEGNPISSRQDFLKLATTPKDEGGLGLSGLDANILYANTEDQFKTAKYNNMVQTQKEIEGAWKYLTSSIPNETMHKITSLFGLGKSETLDYKQFTAQMMTHILNDEAIELEDIRRYYNEGKGMSELPFFEAMDLAQKTELIHKAASKVITSQIPIMDAVGNKLLTKKTDLTNKVTKYTAKVNNWNILKDDTQFKLDQIKDKHGAWEHDSGGRLIYVPNVNYSLWPDGDKDSIDEINESIKQIDQTRLDLKYQGIELKSLEEEYSAEALAFNKQNEEFFNAMHYDHVNGKFKPVFKQTYSDIAFDEMIRKIPYVGMPGDVVMGGLNELSGFWLDMKMITGTVGGIAKIASNPYSLLAAVVLGVGDKTGVFDYFYESGPMQLGETNRGYTHMGMMFDAMLTFSQKGSLPTSSDPESKVFKPNYQGPLDDVPIWEMAKEAIKERDLHKLKTAKNLTALKLYDHMFGKGSNWNLYSGGKSFTQLLAYVAMIRKAGVGLPAKTFGTKRKLVKAGAKFERTFTKLGQEQLGKSISHSLSRSFMATQRFTGALRMVDINQRITLLNNIADGRARGLDRADAFTYGNFLSLATGVSQAIMPDYLWFKSAAGKKVKADLLKALQNKSIGKIAKEKATALAAKQFVKNFWKEQLEEQMDIGLQDVVKSLYIAGHSPEIFNVRTQAEVLSMTSLLTIPLGGLGAIGARRNVKETVYNYVSEQAEELIAHGNASIQATKEKLNSLGNSDRDQALKKILNSEIAVLQENLKDVRNIKRAINVGPELVTDKQIDLLMRKNKLLDQKAKLNLVDKVANSKQLQSINKEIEGIDKEIEESSIESYHATLYDRILKNAMKLTKSLGITIDHQVFAEKDYLKAVEVVRKQRLKHNKDIDDQISKIKPTKKNQKEIDKLQAQKLPIPSSTDPGVIYYDWAGKKGNHYIIINENQAKAAGNEAVIIHELLHAMLRKTILARPDHIRGLSYLIENELLKNPEKYRYVLGKFAEYRKIKQALPEGEVSQWGKKYIKTLNPDELFTVFTEALVQGDIRVETGVISKIHDTFRRMLREVGINWQIKGYNGMVNFLRDFNREVLSGRDQFSLGMKNILQKGTINKRSNKSIINISSATRKKAEQAENILIAKEKLTRWRPDVSTAFSVRHRKTKVNIYEEEKIARDLELSEKTKAIVDKNSEIRKQVLEEGIERDGKIVASEDLQNQLIENNLPAAMALAKFAANNPKIMGLEKGKRVTYEEFLSGYYLQLSNLARTYDASVNEFGQYMNIILPRRYGQILEAEKAGAIEAGVDITTVPDIAIDEDVDKDVGTVRTIDTAERFGVKGETKPFIDKGLKQLRKLRSLQEKLAEKQDAKVENELAEVTADLESKGMADLDLEAITVKQAPNLLYKFVSKLFGIDEDKLNPRSNKFLANLRKAASEKFGNNEVRAAQRAVLKNIDVIMSTVFNEGHTAAFKSSGMPNSLLKFGYNKSSKRIAGSYPQYKKPNLSSVDLLKFIGVEKVTKNGVTGYTFTVDRNTGTRLLAIASMTDRNMSLQAINESLEDSGDMSATVKNSIQDGLSNASKSIYYINNPNLQTAIREKLPILGEKLGNINTNWAGKDGKWADVINVIEEVYKDTKVNGRKFAKSMLIDTGILKRYDRHLVGTKAMGRDAMTFKEFANQELGELDIFLGLNKMLGIDVDKKSDLYTETDENGRYINVEAARKTVSDFTLRIDKLVEDGTFSEKQGMELLMMLERQHITAGRIGNFTIKPATPGSDIIVKTSVRERKDKSLSQRDQLFASALDYRKFINSRMNTLQMPLDTKKANEVRKKLGIAGLFAQKSKKVIEDLMKGVFDFKGRKKEALLARKLVKLQIQFYGELYNNEEISSEEFMMHVLTFGSNMNTASRRAAFVYGIQQGLLSGDVDGKYVYGKMKNIGKDVEYEHGKPHEQLMLELVDIILNEKPGKQNKNWDTKMDEAFADYEVNVITKKMDNTLTLSKRKSRMGAKYIKGVLQGWTQRLFNEENLGHKDVGVIVSLDGKKTKHGESHVKSSSILYKPVSETIQDRKVSSSIQLARSINYSDKHKGITVLDFDDTLATTESLVRYTAPDGTTGTLNAEQYASTYQDLLAKGYVFDFTQFDKIVKGKLAPLFNKALKLQKKFGPRNMFILTARPVAAQKAIFDFLRANGLNIPMKNIATLGNSTSEAKALWITERVSEGYNDFYFADDALQNVQAVENVLEQLDVKGKVQQARSKSVNYDREFNEILENTSGVDAEKRFSKAKARRRGEDKGKYKFFIPPSAEDFVGLIYHFLGKGARGESQFKWFKKVLLEPLNRAYRELNLAKQAIANDYKQLGKEFSSVRKKMYKKIGGTDYTHGDAIRVYLWNKFDFYIPGLSESDKNELVELIESDPELKAFADALGVISKQKDGYVQPSDDWMVEDIRADLMNATSTVNRKIFFQEFMENADIVFSEENLNKIEAIYGQNFREALEDILYRVKNGTNRSFGSNRLVNRFMNWINGSIGVTMHFNTRSAVLQGLSTVNFINWTDNNVIAAAKAFANQKQFWTDFAMIFNSSMLKQRRAGLNIDVNANEIASHVANSKKPFRSALNWMLQKGFLPTQMMDSFAIAAGGATLYRNRLNTYLVQGMNVEEAKKKAFADFQVIAEETQQSARPDMISQQQASVLGRLILAFQNTPIQYARLMKKAIADLANGRGDVKTNVSKIVYYGAVQNIIFYSLQTALFAMMFGDEDDEEFFDKKQQRVMNGTLDSLLRGMGVGGAVVSTLKNMVLKFAEQQDVPRWKKDEYAVLMEMLNLSPPIGIKARQMIMAQRNINWNQDTIKQMPLYNLDNPAWESAFLATQSITNIPLARIQTKVTNLREAANKENEVWQRIAMFLGWSKWNLGVKSKKKTKKISGTQASRRSKSQSDRKKTSQASKRALLYQ